jgi:hypothetical protein
MSAEKRAFYRFHASLMEPWDGPACIAFTDGTLIGAVLDRNGLRPSRYWVTDDDIVIMASEVGVVNVHTSETKLHRQKNTALRSMIVLMIVTLGASTYLMNLETPVAISVLRQSAATSEPVN